MKRTTPFTPRRGGWQSAFGRCTTTGKRAFPNRGVARRARRLTPKDQGGGDIYRCRYCDKYHLTTYPANVMRAIRYLLRSLTPHERRLWRDLENA